MSSRCLAAMNNGNASKMWPMLLDMTEEESVRSLRILELEAYSGLVTALRAQGPLSQEKLKLLKETCNALHIPADRHKAEVRRAVNDEKLNTIAYYASGQMTTLDDWIKESLRLIPLMPRMAPQTAYSVIADETSETVGLNNKQLPLPACTERRRSSTQTSGIITNDLSKSLHQYRMPPDGGGRGDEVRKRRLPFCTENSSLAQHLIGQPKVSRLQQIYRHRTKTRSKEQLLQKVKQEQQPPEKQEPALMDCQRNLQAPLLNHATPKYPYKLPQSPQPGVSNLKTGSGNNPLLPAVAQQNMTTATTHHHHLQYHNQQYLGFSSEEHHPDYETDSLSIACKEETAGAHPQQSAETTNINSSNNGVTDKPKTIINVTKCAQSAVYANKTAPTLLSAGDALKPAHSFKVCPAKKALAKGVTTTAAGQKLIVVPSAAQPPNNNNNTVNSSNGGSILQHTLTIPFVKNISMKNLDKFKIVSTASSGVTIVTNSSGGGGAISTGVGNVKHKVVTVRTNSASSKKIIPISQLQLLNAKGGIKVLPLGSKIVSKGVTASNSPLYIVNSGVQAATKSTASAAAAVMTCRTQEAAPKGNEDFGLPHRGVENATANEEVGRDFRAPHGEEAEGREKSSILADILKASGVVTSDTEDNNHPEPANSFTEATLPENSPRLDPLLGESKSPLLLNRTAFYDAPPAENRLKFDGGGAADVVAVTPVENHDDNYTDVEERCDDNVEAGQVEVNFRRENSPEKIFEDDEEEEEEHGDTFYILHSEQEGGLVQYHNEEEDLEAEEEGEDECEGLLTVADVNCIEGDEDGDDGDEVENLGEQYSVEITTTKPHCLENEGTTVQIDENSVVLDIQQGGPDVLQASAN